MVSFLVAFLSVRLSVVVKAGMYSADTLSSDSLVPINPGIASLPDESGMAEKITAGFSEIVDVPTMVAYDASSFKYPRENCPHLWTGLTQWESVWPGQSNGDVTLPLNTRVIMTKTSLDVLGTHTFGRIYVPASSQLIFDDSELVLNVAEILVEGVLWMGSVECRLYAQITINLLGTKAASNYVSNSGWTRSGLKPSKGIVADNGGILEMHGKQYLPTFTRLARTVSPGSAASDVIYLQDCVNWEVGQRILLTTTIWFDCHDDYKDEYCSGVSHQNEMFEIIGIDSCNTLQMNDTVRYEHFASGEYQGEVALLDRRIRVHGQRTTDTEADGFGAHILVRGASTGRIRGVHCAFCGQMNVMGRYPFHLHLLGDGQNAAESYFEENVVLNSQFRCFTVHGTNHSLIQRNIAFNVYGMCYYLEDGVEENVTMTYNLASFIHPILEPADCCGQGGEDFVSQETLLVPADTSASGFYMLIVFLFCTYSL